MKMTIPLAIGLAPAAALTAPSFAKGGGGGGRTSYGGGSHTSNHGGSHQGGNGGSSHKGGTYVSPRGSKDYGTHRR